MRNQHQAESVQADLKGWRPIKDEDTQRPGQDARSQEKTRTALAPRGARVDRRDSSRLETEARNLENSQVTSGKTTGESFVLEGGTPNMFAASSGVRAEPASTDHCYLSEQRALRGQEPGGPQKVTLSKYSRFCKSGCRRKVGNVPCETATSGFSLPETIHSR